jgi:hypothetical protein
MMAPALPSPAPPQSTMPFSLSSGDGAGARPRADVGSKTWSAVLYCWVLMNIYSFHWSSLISLTFIDEPVSDEHLHWFHLHRWILCWWTLITDSIVLIKIYIDSINIDDHFIDEHLHWFHAHWCIDACIHWWK